MFRKTLIAANFAIVASVMFAPSTASAGIPIPCTGDKIVKIADMPDEMRINGELVHLAYVFQYCTTGKFVLAVVDGSGYYNLDSEHFQAAAEIAVATGQLATIPEAPGFWSSAWHNKGTFWVEWLWIACLVLFCGSATNNKRRYGTFTHPKVIAQREAAAAAQAGTSPANRNVDRATSSQASATSQAQPRRLPRSTPVERSPRTSVPVFGQR